MGRGMCSPGQEIVGLGERRTRLLRKQAETKMQRGRRARQGGRKGALGAGMLAMSPLQAGVPDPLLAHAKAAARLWEPRALRTGWLGAQWQPERCSQLFSQAWRGPASVCPNLKLPCASATVGGKPMLGVSSQARAVSGAELWRFAVHGPGPHPEPRSRELLISHVHGYGEGNTCVTTSHPAGHASGATGVMGCRAEPTGMGVGETRSSGRSQGLSCWRGLMQGSTATAVARGSGSLMLSAPTAWSSRGCHCMATPTICAIPRDARCNPRVGVKPQGHFWVLSIPFMDSMAQNATWIMVLFGKSAGVKYNIWQGCL